MKAFPKVCIVALVTCHCSWSHSAPPEGDVGTTCPWPLLPEAIQKLRAKDIETRKEGFTLLDTFEEGGFSPKEAEYAIVQATIPFPKGERFSGDAAASLLHAATKRPYPHLVPLVEKRFNSFSKAAQYHAADLLIEANSAEGVDAAMRVLHRYGERMPNFPFYSLYDKPRHAKRVFPKVLRFAQNPDHEFDIYRLCLNWCEAGHLGSETLAPAMPQLTTRMNQLILAVKRYEKHLGSAKEREEKYVSNKQTLGILADVFGYLPFDGSVKALQKAAELKDPWPKLFAVLSLLRQNQDVEASHMEAIAASAETRNLLYDGLKELGEEGLFPEQFRSQDAFAESAMVRWLSFPTELGYAPDAIEKMKVFSVEKDSKTYDYYLFRFRASDYSEGKWLAGVAGPYLRAEHPITEGEGGTFSMFNEWDSKSPEEHLAEIAELMEERESDEEEDEDEEE